MKRTVSGVFAVLCIALAFDTAGAAPRPAGASEPTVNEKGLAALNEYRAYADLSPVASDDGMVTGVQNHARYMAEEGVSAHYELTSSPWYSPEGLVAASNSNVSISTTTPVQQSERAAIGRWLTMPFHGLPMLNPALARSAYGGHRAASQLYGAALNVRQGVDRTLPIPSQPVVFPGDGTTTDLLSYDGGESPDPLYWCPNYSAPTGAPLYVFFPEKLADNPNITTTLRNAATSQVIPSCVLHHGVMGGPNDTWGNSLYMRNAVVIIPRSPLQVGTRYTYKVTADGKTAEATFLAGTVASTGMAPIGSFDVAESNTTESVTVSGWTFDGNALNSPNNIRVDVDGVPAGTFSASTPRPDITTVFPDAGPNHGFNVTVPAAAGARQVCVTALNAGAGSVDTQLGCKAVQVRSGNPFGSIDVLTDDGDGLIVTGWAIDPDTTTPITVKVTAGDAAVTVTADADRPDLVGPFPGAGTKHGYTARIAHQPGQDVCVTAINTGKGSNADIGCRNTRFNPLPPARLLDTRWFGPTIDGQGSGAGPVGQQSTITAKVVGRGGVPSGGVSAVALNVTVTEPNAPSFVTVYPTGAPRAASSNINFSPGQSVSNLVVVRPGSDGTISIFHLLGQAHVVVDVVGWWDEGSDLVTNQPLRLADTRPGHGTYDGKGAGTGVVGQQQSAAVTVAGRGGIPTDAKGTAFLNVTSTASDVGGFAIVYPSGAARPMASNLNFPAGASVSNMVAARIGDDGKILVFNHIGTSHYVVDLLGWAPDGLGQTSSINPARLLDTRGAPEGHTVDGKHRNTGKVGQHGVYRLQVTGRAGVPTNAASVIINVTGVNATASTFLSVYPTGTPRPNSSSLNFQPGPARANLVVAKVGTNGQIDIFNLTGTTDIVVDIVGWTI